MRIVAFWDNHKGVARRNQLELIERLNDHCDLAIYGPGGTGTIEGDKKLKPMLYSKHYNIDQIIKVLKPDCFYLSFCERVRGWLPDGFEKTKVPKIIHDRNWFKADKGWYDEKNFDLIIQCQAGLSYLSKKAPTIFLPLSASEREFYDFKLERTKKVLFTGSRGGKHYFVRTAAINALTDSKLIEDLGKALNKDVYAKTLNQYEVGLSDSNGVEVGVAPSKVYEMMACKTAVLMTDFKYSERIFDNGVCWFRYNKDNIVKVAKLALFNNDFRTEMVEKAYEIVHAKHMHKHRVAETYEVIEAFVKDGKLIRKWGE